MSSGRVLLYLGVILSCRSMFRKYKIILGLALLLAAVLGVIVFVWQSKGKGSTQSAGVQSSTTAVSSTGSAQPTETPAVISNARVRPKHVARPVSDQDKDGLFDEDERKQGTDPTKADTDGDGLSDFDELIIYSTDPKQADTDGDTFLDGDEIRGGYDPHSKAPKQLP